MSINPFLLARRLRSSATSFSPPLSTTSTSSTSAATLFVFRSLACCFLLNRVSAFSTPSVVTTSAAACYTTYRSGATRSSTIGGTLNHNNNIRFFTTTTTTSLLAAAAASNKMENPPFPTWSFDKACTKMEWNTIAPVQLDLLTEDPSIVTSSPADLVLLTTFAPPKDDDDDEGSDEEDTNEEKDVAAARMSSVIAQQVDDAVSGGLTQLMQENAKAFKNGAKVGSSTPTLRVIQNGKVQRYIVVGLGTEPKPDEEGNESSTSSLGALTGSILGKTVATKCDSEKKVETVQVVVPYELGNNATLLRDFATGLYQNLYADNRYKTGAKKKPCAEDLKTVTLVVEQAKSNSATSLDRNYANQALEEGRLLAQGVLLTRDIVNAPHNVLNSVSLAETAKRVASECKTGRLKCSILNKADCEKRGMGAYLGVARGSETEPQFIHLTYTPPSTGTPVKKLGIVGKGLLFDTGGYNIKTAMMEAMKFDCGGSAAVLGAARAIAALEPEGVEVHFIVAATENMIDAKAYVPSDILTASNGKTIEVMNTDAEGRLTLADALVYADKEVGCERIIELSTLTGACMISLGKDIAGVWTSNDELATELADVSKATGEKSWRMPMESSYNEQLESKFADLKNIGTKYGGAITAALFLQNFVNKKKPFAHIDIAGPVWNEKFGATGYGAKLIVEWVRRQGSEGK